MQSIIEAFLYHEISNFVKQLKNMTTQQLVQQIKQKKSFLCIGLDVDLAKIPKHLLELEDPIFEFNKAIIDATHDLCVSYKRERKTVNALSLFLCCDF